MNSDFKDLLQLFNRCRVKYLVIGGYAVIHYSEPRYTKDLDIWVEPSEGNSQRVFGALEAFGAPVKKYSAKDFSKPGYFFQMGFPPSRIDILMSVKGLKFGACWKNRAKVRIGSSRYNFIAKTDLIKAKLASGRSQDLVDVELLGGKRKVKTRRS